MASMSGIKKSRGRIIAYTVVLLFGGMTHAQTRSIYDDSLIDACEHNSIDDARRYLTLGANVNAQDRWKVGIGRASKPSLTTPLWWAAYTGNVELAILLIKSGANVNSRNSSGISPLCLVAGSNFDNDQDVTIMRLLLERHANVNARCDLAGSDNSTPLIQACIAGKTTKIRMLLEAGANVNVSATNLNTRDKQKWNAYDYVRHSNYSESQKEELYSLLDQYNPDKNVVANRKNKGKANTTTDATSSGIQESFQNPDVFGSNDNKAFQSQSQTPKRYNTFIQRRNGNWYRYECATGHYFTYDRRLDRVAEHDEQGLEVSVNPVPKESNPVNRNGVQLK